MTNVIIRGYEADDLEACRELWAQLVAWHRALYQDPGIGGPDPGRHFDVHLARVGPDHIWVAEVGGQVAGLAGLIRDGAQAELEPLVVGEDFRGRGIGRRLTEVVVAAARESGVRILTVRPTARNEPAVRFFHAAGFDLLGQLELFMDLRPGGETRWRPGERLAGRDFKV